MTSVLTGYDEWYCDVCGEQVYWSELVFNEGESDVCDSCYEDLG